MKDASKTGCGVRKRNRFWGCSDLFFVRGIVATNPGKHPALLRGFHRSILSKVEPLGISWWFAVYAVHSLALQCNSRLIVLATLASSPEISRAVQLPAWRSESVSVRPGSGACSPCAVPFGDKVVRAAARASLHGLGGALRNGIR